MPSRQSPEKPSQAQPIRVMPERPRRGRDGKVDRPALPKLRPDTPPGRARDYPPDPPGAAPGHNE